MFGQRKFPAFRLLCLLGERAALFRWSRVENRAIDFANPIASKGNPRMIAALDVEFIPSKERPWASVGPCQNQVSTSRLLLQRQLAIRETDAELDAVCGDRLPGKADVERITPLLADDLELDPGIGRT